LGQVREQRWSLHWGKLLVSFSYLVWVSGKYRNR
jgi:hypothetical protein